MKFMKKFLAMLLVLSSIFCIFSCNNNNNDGGNEGNNGGGTNAPEIPVSDGGVSFSEFVAALSAMSSIKTSSVKTTFISEGKGQLVSEFDISYNADGSATVEFTKQRYGDLNADEDMVVTEGPFVVDCDKNGNYTLNGELAGNVIANGAYLLNLDQYKLNNARIEGNALYATVFSTDTKAVLGVEIAATVSISVVVQGGKISSLSAEYVKNGDLVKVSCEYGF